VIDTRPLTKFLTQFNSYFQFGSDKPDTRFGLEVRKYLFTSRRHSLNHLQIINLGDILGITDNQTPTTSVPDLVLDCIVVRKSGDSGLRNASQIVEALHPSTVPFFSFSSG